MKQGWIGVVAGLAVGLTAVFMTQRGGEDGGPRRPTAAEGSAALATCDPGSPAVGAVYDKVAAPLHRYLTSEPAKALEAARGQVANLLDARIAACVRALEVQQARRQASGVDPRIARVAPHLDRLHTARTRLQELIGVLQSPQASDAQAKLDALDAAVHAIGN